MKIYRKAKKRQTIRCFMHVCTEFMASYRISHRPNVLIRISRPGRRHSKQPKRTTVKMGYYIHVRNASVSCWDPERLNQKQHWLVLALNGLQCMAERQVQQPKSYTSCNFLMCVHFWNVSERFLLTQKQSRSISAAFIQSSLSNWEGRFKSRNIQVLFVPRTL